MYRETVLYTVLNVTVIKYNRARRIDYIARM